MGGCLESRAHARRSQGELSPQRAVRPRFNKNRAFYKEKKCNRAADSLKLEPLPSALLDRQTGAGGGRVLIQVLGSQ